jgi:ATP synthase proteolipid subunit
MGCTCAIVFTCLGASYGTAKSGVGIAAMGVLRPDLIVKSKTTHDINKTATPLPQKLTDV